MPPGDEGGIFRLVGNVFQYSGWSAYLATGWLFPASAFILSEGQMMDSVSVHLAGLPKSQSGVLGLL